MPHGAFKRSRTSSTYEEKNVQSYIDSCVNFETNVSFLTAEEGKRVAHKSPRAVLLLGPSALFAADAEAAVAFPHWSPAVKAAAASAPEGKAYVATVTDSQERVLVGKLPPHASRHNSPVRADLIQAIVRAALAEAPAGTGLDVYVGFSGFNLCVAASVARACPHSFSAKSGLAESGYQASALPVRVVLKEIKNADALRIAATSVQLTQRLFDAPTNLVDTTTLAEIASEVAHKLHSERGLDVHVDIIRGEDLRERGYGGLYGTGKAAEFPPHLVTLSYKPKAGIAPLDKIAFVGKGIVYDTGGLAIKSRDGMCTMKGDMGGAAAIFGAFVALARLEAPLEVSCVMCLADNAVGPRAQRNDDIIRMKSGLTIEINNTDAEGRLVLSDGVYHASAELAHTPSIIVDMATLTGAQGVATGKLHAGLYANTEAAEKRFMESGRHSGDLVFPVVYCPELHNAEFTSTVADFRNSVANRSNAQVSCAGQFIGNNLAKTYKGEWVHVDIAGPAGSGQGTGYGVALLLQTFSPEFF